MSTQTIDSAMARRMVEASAIHGASIIGRPGGWSVMLKLGKVEKLLGTQRTDKPRMWRSLDTCMDYLRNELHIVRVDLLDATHYSDGDASRRPRQDASERMKRAHEAAAYDAWFREQVQASIDDPRPSISDDEARARFANRKTALRRRAQ
ncbi:antitoxin PaaA2 family protein [Thauera sinica]|uniref:Stability determinant domain-containing protein n=1 Tax=Thauera sinica TaxID=2665146 RepID=A0ABW1AVN8_9RHOO|nr:hypothetical protein [Thauera sp. K11]